MVKTMIYHYISIRKAKIHSTGYQSWVHRLDKDRDEAGPKNQRHRQGFIRATAQDEGRHSRKEDCLGWLPPTLGGPAYIEKVTSQVLTIGWASKRKGQRCLILIGWKGLVLIGQ